MSGGTHCVKILVIAECRTDVNSALITLTLFLCVYFLDLHILKMVSHCYIVAISIVITLLQHGCNNVISVAITFLCVISKHGK